MNNETLGIVEISGSDFIEPPRNGDAGIDLIAKSGSEYFYDFGELKLIQYNTGVRVAPNDKGIHGFIFPRSSICKYDLILSNSVGVIDSSYRGEIIINFRPLSINSLPREEKLYQKGDKIAQLIFLKTPALQIVSVDKLGNSDTVRGEGGFGSTGK